MDNSLKDYSSVKSYLYGLKHRGAFYGIDRMKKFAEVLGHPEGKYPIIHVAGTNGKGSTCAMLESVFRHAGYKTGLFTSPHLIHQGERVQVNREILSHAAIVDYTAKLKPIAEELESAYPDHHPTFFEFMTGMAFLRFAEADVDVGIIETGLGGRLDATNIVDPIISIITSISLDHTEILGNTIEEIAREKAGIIKRGKPVVIGFLPAAAEAVIREIATERGCKLYSARETFSDDFSLYPETALPGDYQRRNAATVALAIEVIATSGAFQFAEDAVETGLKSVRWAGRWERHSIGDKEIILDASHNPEGVLELEKNLAKLRQEVGDKIVILAGTLGEKRAQALIPAIARHAREIYLLMPKQPRACSFAEMRRFLPASSSIKVVDSELQDLFPDVGKCVPGNAGDVVVATGSIYLIGEIYDRLYHAVPVGEETLQD